MINEKAVYHVPIFATPLLFSRFKKHGTHQFPDIPKKDRKPKGWILPVNTSFPGQIEENINDPYMSMELLTSVHNDILEHCKGMMESIGAPSDISLTQFWYNSYYEGQGQEVHNHLSPSNINPFWSGIYFAKNCYRGQLQFSNMEHGLRTQPPWPHQLSKLKEYYHSVFCVGGEDGNIVLFPPFLNHHVKVGIENRHKMRLTFSFNIRINREAYLGDEHLRNGQASS
mgnify:CR=1 FL=1